jgi:hypothetical protein
LRIAGHSTGADGVFDLVLGVLDAHTFRFKSHGHLVRLRIRGDAVRRVMRGSED